MLSDLESQLLQALDSSKLSIFLNGGTISSNVLKGWNKSDQEWLDFINEARAHIRWERFQAVNCADDAYYFTQDHSDAKLRAKEISIEQSKNQVKVTKGSGGFDYLFMELESMVQDTFRLKELKGLILESRPSKSKWASDEKLGQEPLYEAFEKVLAELRNYTEHSLPFLKPVQKREAPNYYDVIKNPMDLGTMAKKLKNLDYKSKEEFGKDLNLIWNNCFAYNTLPESIYRKHANSMRLKAEELMKNVPEISVKTGVEESDDDEGSKLGTTAAASASVNGDSTPGQNNSRRPLTFAALEEDQDGMDLDFTENMDSLDTPLLDGQKDDDTHHSEHGEEDDDEQLPIESSWDSVQFQKWKELSLEQRAHIYKRHYIDSGVRFENKKAFVRTSDAMLDFYCQEVEYMERIKRLEDASSSAYTASGYWEKAFLPELMPPTSIMPHIKQPYADSPSSMISLSKIASANIDKSSNIYQKVCQNISELDQIKKLYYNIEGEPFHPRSHTHTGDTEALVSSSVHLGKEEATKILGQSISLLMNHVGFDAIYESALCTFTDLVVEYISNFGRSIKLCLDSADPGITIEEILEYALAQNGVHDIQILQSHILDLVSKGKRLSNTKNYLTGIQNRILLKQEKSNTITDEEENELVMSGNYLSALGIDILNVKEVGIDITEVPLELWNEKAQKQVCHVDDRLASPMIGPRVDELSISWAPIVGAKQIGLLKAFYERPASALIEDDQKPNVKSLKSKVMVRAATVRKRLVIGTDNIPKKKKKSTTSNKME